MRIRLNHLVSLIVLAVISCGVLFSQAQAKETAFEALRASMPAKLKALRERADEAGGKDISLALLLGSYNKDARLVASTVLVYQEYPKERRLGVLLAAAIRVNEKLDSLQQVQDKTLQTALQQAPEDMEGIDGMFQVVDALDALPQAQFQKAVVAAQTVLRGRVYVQRTVTQTLQNRAQQTTRADSN